MFDFIEPIIDPIVDPYAGEFTHFIAQMDAFLDTLEKDAGITIPRPLSEETFKQMWMLRYQQHMGQMTFLELLDKYEEILGISPRSASE